MSAAATAIARKPALKEHQRMSHGYGYNRRRQKQREDLKSALDGFIERQALREAERIRTKKIKAHPIPFGSPLYNRRLPR